MSQSELLTIPSHACLQTQLSLLSQSGWAYFCLRGKNAINRMAQKQQIFTPHSSGGWEVEDHDAGALTAWLDKLPHRWLSLHYNLTRQKRQETAHCGIFYKCTDHLPKAPPPNGIMLGIRISTYIGGGDTFSPLHLPPGSSSRQQNNLGIILDFCLYLTFKVSGNSINYTLKYIQNSIASYHFTINTVVTSHLDYCNNLLATLPIFALGPSLFPLLKYKLHEGRHFNLSYSLLYPRGIELCVEHVYSVNEWTVQSWFTCPFLNEPLGSEIQ